MKYVYGLLFMAGGAITAVGQTPKKSYSKDKELSRWVIDVNILGGLSSQNFKATNSVPNYLNAVNANAGDLKYANGLAYGADGQLGFFFGKKRHFGLGAGFMYLREQGDAILNNYHVEYQATDFKGSTFRQVITGNDLREALAITNMNIPVMLKYKNRFSKHWGFTADLGALFNVQMKSAYTAHSNFDYEAIYRLVPNADGAPTGVYDNSPTPSRNDWMITKAEFLRNNPNGNMAAYFNDKRALGYSVGLNEPTANGKGDVSYSKGSVGFMLQPSFNYFLSDHVALNIGGYYLMQPFKNTNSTNYHLTDGSGNYSSMLNNVTTSVNQSYGINIGARFFLGKSAPPLRITATDQASPTQCGFCDGSIVLHGLTPNEQATIDYKLNGTAQKSNTAMVQQDGVVKIPNLCAGTYTDIVATIHKKKATATTVILGDPQLNIILMNRAQPTVSGVCDGSVKFGGLAAGKTVTISYRFNGYAQPVFTGVVNSDNTITVGSLCEGKYTGITAASGTCTTKGDDFELVAPTPPPPPVKETPVVTEPTVMKGDISTPILFETDRSHVPETYYAEIDEAAKQLKENRGAYLVIDGNADTTGVEAHNEGLSLRRANAVKVLLVQRGIQANRIKSKGHGSDVPAAPNETPEGRQKNRRSVMTLVPYKN